MIKSNTELANHICNEVHGLNYEIVLERLEKIRPHESETELLPESVDTFVEEFREFYTVEHDF